MGITMKPFNHPKGPTVGPNHGENLWFKPWETPWFKPWDQHLEQMWDQSGQMMVQNLGADEFQTVNKN